MAFYSPEHRAVQPIGFSVSGAPISPIMGSRQSRTEGGSSGQQSVQDQGGQSNGQGDQSQGQGQGQGGQGQGASRNQDDDDDDGDDGTGQPDKVSRDEYRKLQRRLRKADKRAGEAEGKVQAYEDAEKSEVEKAQGDVAKANGEIERLKKHNKQLAIQIAFLKNNSYDWHDAEAALKLVDLSEVEIDDDGGVSGMEDAVTTLATSKPFLLKPQSQGGQTQGGQTQGGQTQGGQTQGGQTDDSQAGQQLQSTGAHGSSGNNERQTDRDALRRKYRLGR